MKWRRHTKTIVPVAMFGALFLAIGLSFYWPYAQISERLVRGTVTDITQARLKTGLSGNMWITVLLEDGSTVTARHDKESRSWPRIGRSIELVEREFSNGRVTYTLKLRSAGNTSAAIHDHAQMPPDGITQRRDEQPEHAGPDQKVRPKLDLGRSHDPSDQGRDDETDREAEEAQSLNRADRVFGVVIRVQIS